MTLNVPQSQTPKTTRLRDLYALRVRHLPLAENAESAEVRPLHGGKGPHGTSANGDRPPLVDTLTERVVHPRQHPSHTRQLSIPSSCCNTPSRLEKVKSVMPSHIRPFKHSTIRSFRDGRVIVQDVRTQGTSGLKGRFHSRAWSEGCISGPTENKNRPLSPLRPDVRES